MNDNQSESGYSEFQQPPVFQSPKTNGKTIAALVMGILAVVLPYIGFIIGIVAIVFANLSIKEIKRTRFIF